MSIGISLNDLQAAQIKKVHRGVITLPEDTHSVIVKLDEPIVLSKSFLQFSTTTQSGRPGDFLIGGRLIDSVTIGFYRHNHNSYNPTFISWEIFEFRTGVKVQRGTIVDVTDDTTNNSLDSTILKKFIPDKTFILTKKTAKGDKYDHDDLITPIINNNSDSQSVSFLINGAVNDSSVLFWQLVEYDSCRVARTEIAIPPGSTEVKRALGAPAKLSKSIIISYFRTSFNVSSFELKELPIVEMLSSDTILFSRRGNISTNVEVRIVAYLIRFQDGTFTSQNISYFDSHELSKKEKLPLVNRNCTGINNPNNYGQDGYSYKIGTDSIGFSYFTTYLSDRDSILIARSDTGGIDGNAELSYQIVSFSGCKAELNLGKDTFLCQYDSLVLGNSKNNLIEEGVPPFNYEWTLNDTFFSSDSSITIFPLDDGNSQITLRITDNFGSVGIDTLSLDTKYITALIDNSDTIFTNELLELASPALLFGGDSPYKYEWQPHELISSDTVLTPTFSSDSAKIYSYTLRVNDSNNCSNDFPVEVHVINPLEINGIDSFICLYDSIQLANSVISGNQPYKHQWINNNEFLTNNASAVVTAFPDSSTSFIFQVTDNYGLTSSDTIDIVVYNLPKINMLSYDTIFLGEKLLLSDSIIPVTGINSPFQISWSPAQYLSGITDPSPIFAPTELGDFSYHVIVEDNKGCIGFDSITVLVKKDTFFMTVPSAFSPNSDLLNDSFSPILSKEVNTILIQIFDRKGNILFETIDPKVKWDGTHKGILVEAGNYLYYIFATSVSGETSERKGIITLLR